MGVAGLGVEAEEMVWKESREGSAPRTEQTQFSRAQEATFNCTKTIFARVRIFSLSWKGKETREGSPCNLLLTRRIRRVNNFGWRRLGGWKETREGSASGSCSPRRVGGEGGGRGGKSGRGAAGVA